MGQARLGGAVLFLAAHLPVRRRALRLGPKGFYGNRCIDSLFQERFNQAYETETVLPAMLHTADRQEIAAHDLLGVPQLSQLPAPVESSKATSAGA
jgi:hypothetical protein